MTDAPVDVLVVGAGIIGLSVAWRAGAAGLSVRVVERERPGAGATPVAAGILSPVTAAGLSGTFGAFNRRAMASWEDFADELSGAAGVRVPYRSVGALHVARDGEHARLLALADVLDRSSYQWLDAAQCRELEPELCDGLSGLLIPDEAATDTETLIPALLAACAAQGVIVSSATAPTALLRDAAGRCLGLELSDHQRQAAGTTVIAAGAWSGALEWLPEALRPPVTPLFGEMLLLQAHTPVAQHIIRSVSGSLSPRASGRYWAGTTTRETGFADAVTVSGVMSILANHLSLIPALGAASLLRAGAAFRPRTPDERPIVGWAAPGLLYATGHGRKGILQAPLTASAVCGLLVGEPLPADMQEFSPARFG